MIKGKISKKQREEMLREAAEDTVTDPSQSLRQTIYKHIVTVLK